MSDSPQISVIIPLYNKAAYIEEAVRSVLNQSYKDFELIIVDDGSIDGSQQVVKEINDSRIHFYQNAKNLGTAANANRCIELCKGKYIARLDADDIMLPERLKIQFELMERFPEVGISSGAVELFGTKTETWYLPLLHDELAASLLFSPPIAQGASIMRREVLVKHNLRYDEGSSNVAEDWLMWFKFFKVTRFANSPEVLIRYRQYEGNITNPNNHSFYESRKFLYEKMFEGLGLPIEKVAIHFFTKPYFAKPVSKQDVREYAVWISYLREWNSQKKIFNEKLFNDKLDLLWDRFFYFLPEYGIGPTVQWYRISGWKIKKIVYMIKVTISNMIGKKRLK